jgi:NAD(P)H dehydrogenase (quinone)
VRVRRLAYGDGVDTIAITGSTGVIGGLVARSLAADGLPQRLLVRDLDRAPVLPGAEAVLAPFGDRAAVESALAGVETVLMVSASESADRLDQHRSFVDAATAAGVAHIVYISFLNASPTATFTLARDHYATEQHILATGIAHTFLRDALYLDFMEALVGDDGVIRGPAGEGRVSGVSRRDVADVAAAVLRAPHAHRGAVYDLTGPEDLTMAEIAAVVAEARGEAVSFHNETLAEAYESRARWGAPDWQNDAWVSTYTAIAAGEMRADSDAVLRVTGRAPRSLAEVLAS